MPKVEFKVEGHMPPMKDGAQSMWGKKNNDASRLIALRRAADEALRPHGRFTGKVQLTLKVQVKAIENQNPRYLGDLDNFVTGVCDGLMAAHPNMLAKYLHDLFLRPENSDVHPKIAIAYKDDSQVTRIVAEKHIGGDEPSYTVVLEGE